VDHFLEKYNREANRKVTIVPRDVLDTLVAYSWPEMCASWKTASRGPWS